MECAASTTLHTPSSLQILNISRHGRSTPGVDTMLSMIATTLRLVPDLRGRVLIDWRCRWKLVRISVPDVGKFKMNSEMLGLGLTSQILYAALEMVLNAVLAAKIKVC